MDSTLSSLLTDIPIPEANANTGFAKTLVGRNFPPQQQILLYESGEWEIFTQEWAHSQKEKYVAVSRFSGANDLGIDVAAFTDDKGLEGVWDNYQCKHYKEALTPSVAIVEIGKILWHTFNKKYARPRKHFFIAPRDCGMKLEKLFTDNTALKAYVIANWDANCSESITSKLKIPLEGEFKEHVDSFDFSIFSSKRTLEILDEHRLTPYFVTRFGGGLPERPAVEPPPSAIEIKESRYIEQLFEIYSEHTKSIVNDITTLKPWADLGEHFHRQREFFYHAEALRNFARDTVPPGTFESLQGEVYSGVKDLESNSYSNGYERLTVISQAATSLQLTANALIGVVMVQDKKGICHQLANEDKLTWRK